MGKKTVYLFELDSVRRTDREIVAGQQALFREIVCNGNTVALTFNQLVDSRGFFSLLTDPEYHQNLLELFRQGAIKVSQYGDIRTIVQYLIQSFGFDKQFIYSGWPLKSTQKRLLALMKRSLIYSDLSEISGYLGRTEGDEELRDLFTEVVDGQTRETALSAEEIRGILDNLYWLLRTVLELSMMQDIYIAPRDPAEYSGIRFHHILRQALSLPPSGDTGLWESARAVIEALPCLDSDSRSVYLRELRAAAAGCGGAGDRRPYQYAEAILNVCYNYSNELSIQGVSKHYNAEELASPDSDKPTFTADFFSRLAQDWNMGGPEERYLQEESSDFREFSDPEQIPDFAEAVRMTQYAAREESTSGVPAGGASCKVHRYEHALHKQRRTQTARILSSIGRRCLLAVACILVACLIEIGIQLFQGLLDDVIDFHTMGWTVVETLCFLGITEFVTAFLARKFPWMISLSDALGSLARLLGDARRASFRREETYQNSAPGDTDKTESQRVGNSIDFVTSDAIKRYLQMLRNPIYQEYLRDSDVYPLADPRDPAVVKSLCRLEELYNYHFGVVYQSPYNMMCVDPIQVPGRQIFPYERVLPSTGRSGVVIIPRRQGRFLLLQQYRHAPREEQICFPRGYGEAGLSDAANAAKELMEEIHAAPTGVPVLLGTLTADSGVLGAKVKVYLVDVESAVYQDTEGIREILEFTGPELEDKIRSGEIQDGFTLSACQLYRAWAGARA